MQNSWYIKEEGVHHFVCKCGKDDIHTDNFSEEYDDFEIIKFKREEIDFSKIPNLYYPDNICSQCGNEKYLDLEALLFDHKTRCWSTVNWKYKEETTTNGWRIGAFIKIPKLNKQTKIITTEYVELASYQVNIDGEDYFSETNKFFLRKSMLVDENYLGFNKILKSDLDTKMTALILKNPSENLEWLNEEEITLEGLLFLLKNPNIRSIDMCFWKNKEYFLKDMNKYRYVDKFLVYTLNNRKEKSLRKFVFNSYVKMMEFGEYNPMTDYIFSRTISDVNHLNRALNLDIEVKKKLFNGCNVVNINHFIDFLKNFYDEKHIVQLWLNISADDLRHYLVRDSIELFNNKEMREEFKKNFHKTSLNIRAIHYELTRYSRRVEKLRMKNEQLSYSDLMMASEVSREGIFYKLPSDAQELYEWGSILHNCLFSYKKSILNGRSIVFGLFVNRQLTYALEIRDNKIVQLSARYNRTLSEKERDKVDRWYKEVYMFNLMKLFR